MKLRILILAAIALLPLLSCGNGAVSAELDDIESYIQERPDSALATLQAIDTLRLTRNPDKAHYKLLTAWALDKNSVDNGRYLDEAEDAAEWYRTHGSKRHRMLSQYYYGDQQYDSGDLSGAILCFAAARDLADAQQDWFYAGMASRGIGLIFGREYEYEDAAKYYSTADSLFCLSNKPLYAAFARLQAAISYHNELESEKAAELYSSVRAAADTLNDNSLLRDYYVSYANYCFHLQPPEPEKTILYIDSALVINGNISNNAIFDLIIAYHNLGDDSSAASYYSIAAQRIKTHRDSMRLRYSEYLIKKAEGDSRTALLALEDVFDDYESKRVDDMKHSSHSMLREHLLRQQEVERLQTNHRQFAFVAILIVLLIGIIGVTVVYVSLLKKKEQRILAESLAAEAAREKLALYQNTNTPAIHALASSFEEICRDKSDRSISEKFNVVLYKMKRDQLFHKELLSTLYEKNPESRSYIQNTLCQLEGDDRVLLILHMAGMPRSVIALVLNISLPTLHKRIERLQKKVDKQIL